MKKYKVRSNRISIAEIKSDGMKVKENTKSKIQKNYNN